MAAPLFALAAVACAGRAGDDGREDDARTSDSLDEADPGDASAIRITLRPSIAGRAGVDVRLEIGGPPLRRLRALVMQTGFGGTSGPSLVEGLEFIDAAGSLDFALEREAGRFVLGRPVAGKRLVVEYFARSDPAHSALGLHVDRGHMSGVGHGFLLVPAFDDVLDVRVRFDFGGLPGGGWLGASTFGVGRDVGARAAPAELAHAVYAAGLVTVADGAFGERVVAVGNLKASLSDVLAASRELVHACRRTFGLWEPPSASILLVDAPELGSGLDGVWLGRSMALWFAGERGFDDRVRILLAHEWVHSFVGSQVRVASATPDGEQRAAKWFSEGFTVHFARELALEAGIITPAEFVADVNRSVDEADDSLGKPIDALDDGAAEQRGSLYAARLKAVAARRGKNLGALLVDMAREATSTPSSEAQAGVPTMSVDRFRALLTSRFGAAEAAHFAVAVERGERPVDVPAGAFGPCIRRRRRADVAFDLGFDPRSLETDPPLVRGVVRRSRAYRAGLRDGQLLLEFAGIAKKDPRSEVVLTVTGATGTRRVHYLPLVEVRRTRYELAAVASCRGSARP